MDVVRAQLLKHQTTRRFGSFVSTGACEDVSTCPALEPRQREALSNHRRVVDALISYVRTVPRAFDLLASAQAALREVEVDDAHKTSHALVAGLLDACQTIHSMATDTEVQLDALRMTLNACADDLSLADKATTELERYSGKVETLTDSAATDKQAAQKLERNRAKLQRASVSASAAQLRAKDSLQQCLGREAQINNLAQGILGGTAEAITQISAKLSHVASASSYPPPPPPSRRVKQIALASTEQQCVASAAENPFPLVEEEEDKCVQRGGCGEEQLQLNVSAPPLEPTGSNPFDDDVADDTDMLANPFEADDANEEHKPLCKR